MAKGKTSKPSAGDLAEVAAGKGSARDKAEAGAYRSLGKKRAAKTKRRA